MIYLIGTVLAIGVLTFVLYPSFSKNRQGGKIWGTERGDNLRNLLERKAELYASITDLDFEHKMGRLSEDDYNELRGEYKIEATELLKNIDLLEGKKGVEELIELEVSFRRRNGKGKISSVKTEIACPSCESINSASNNFCSGCGLSLRTQTCTNCGFEFEFGTRFCTECGKEALN